MTDPGVVRVRCPRCEGAGVVPGPGRHGAPVRCPTCAGRGSFRGTRDDEPQDTVPDQKKSCGPQIVLDAKHDRSDTGSTVGSNHAADATPHRSTR